MIIVNALIVFALTLILTKSKVLGGKREFVELRYEAAKVNNEQPGWIHRWWHAIWTCAMCSGFWIAIPVSIYYPVHGIVPDVLVVFGLNWLLHCSENLLFFGGEVLKNADEEDLIEKIEQHIDQARSETFRRKNK